ncbi:MAG: hypothetical protein Q9218_008244 [Villophora microphyllina]
MAIPLPDTGDRQLFHATSARYPSLAHSSRSGHKQGSNDEAVTMAPLPSGVVVAEGSNGIKGSGAYLPVADSESAKSGTGKWMKDYRERGVDQKVWKHTQDVFKGRTSVPVPRMHFPAQKDDHQNVYIPATEDSIYGPSNYLALSPAGPLSISTPSTSSISRNARPRNGCRETFISDTSISWHPMGSLKNYEENTI